MNDETIFKKCNSKTLLFQNSCEQVNVDRHQEDSQEGLSEIFTSDFDIDDQLEDLSSPKKNIETSANIHIIPEKVFSGTKHVLKIIGWISDKWNTSNTTLPPTNTSPESGIYNQEENSQGRKCFMHYATIMFYEP